MRENFARSLERVLVHEGGKVDHPKDPGGRTNQGVIQRVYDGYRKNAKKPLQDVYLMTDAERDEIYRRQYWAAVQGDRLPDGVDYVVFDGAVNSGPGQSIKWLQRALGIDADGVIGAVTLQAVASFGDYDELINQICDRRMAFLKALKTWATFGKGWQRRVDGVQQAGQAWATGSVAPKPASFISGGNAKAKMEDAKQAPSKGAGDAATGAGAGSGVLSQVIGQAQEQLTPLSMAGDWISTLVVILIVAGALLAVGGLAWRWYANRRKAELADALDLQPVSK
jgi:lysozyme family protein